MIEAYYEDEWATIYHGETAAARLSQNVLDFGGGA